MAGRKQHFIPQALQRGFGFAKGKKTQVYVFKNGRLPYLSSTEGVAAQRDFYSEPSEEESLDDQITKYEGQVLAPALVALRETPIGPIDSHVAAAVVVHLSMRSEFVRSSYSAMTTGLIDVFIDALNCNETARTFLEVDSLRSESPLIKLIEEEMLSHFGTLPESGRDALVKFVHFRVREKFPQMLPELAANFLEQMGLVLEKMPEVIDSGHNRALEKDIAPILRIERLKTMNWQILRVEPPAHFVLPDCLALGAETSNFLEMAPYSLLNDAELAGVVMPICSNKVLVGSIGSAEIDVTTLNRSFAQCSFEFFISSQSDAETVEAAQLLGSSVYKYVDMLVKGQQFEAPERDDGELKLLETGCLEQEEVKVSIKFEPSSRKSGKAQAVVRRLMSAPELQAGLRCVEEIVISDNIVRSLQKRGVSLNVYDAQAVRLGTCHVIEKSGELCCQLFITLEAVNLVARKHPFAHAAAALICYQAGRATYYATLSSKIPKEAWERERSQLESIGLRVAHQFCSHYFGGRLAGDIQLRKHEFQAIESLYSHSLADCVQGITNARLHFIEHRDVDVALLQALGHVELLLCATSKAIAATGGEIKLWMGTESINALKAVGLGEWFELFALDLARFFESRQQLNEDTDLVILGSHVERVLWSFGIVLSAPALQQIWMDVLGDQQLMLLRAQ